MMRRWVAVLIFLAAPLWAQTYPDYDRTTITDRADLLTDAQETALDTRLNGLRGDTGIELAVLTLPSQIPYAADQTLEQFATGLFDHWGIGNATRNDGILVLILSDDRAMRIELGAGYGRDWDRVAANVVDRSFLPAFSNDDYATGITEGVEDVIASIALPFSEGTEAPASDDLPPWMVIASVIGALLIAARRILGDLLARLRPCPSCGRRTLRRKRKTPVSPTRTSTGRAETVTRCNACSYHDVQTYTISRISSSRSSFGGGRSGGGGASGRW
ncbi:YgcG family protein [Marivita sp. XM-24bin2]|jgi:uncharacterized protein|uniref:TPM domain-containing protein n=1 Tax=unclassified Marivita TaxID=2632480 RepID=UPI000D7B27D6|nr:TPM domain-containing protein [Marivita sp. XM-24bin2]MCR9107913.1 TPM domain-containing protein [Paracoccaceae bacterium]PWL33755.1 MAG: hypothetical protein DCO97_17905 [Marivita sp. XM-24bin2]